MIQDVALLTILFDYPVHAYPLCYNNASKFFDQKDIHIARFNNLIQEGSYYDKLYFYKVEKLLEYITDNIYGKYRYILFLDAKDTNFYKSPVDIVEKFTALDRSIVFGAEKGLWPNTNYTHLYDKKVGADDAEYLNSGTYFGYTDQIITHLTRIKTERYQEGIDDQGKWTIEYLLHDDIILDYNRQFFFSTYEAKNFVDDADHTKLKGISPYIVHDNGPFGDTTVKIAHLIIL